MYEWGLVQWDPWLLYWKFGEGLYTDEVYAGTDFAHEMGSMLNSWCAFRVRTPSYKSLRLVS